MHRMFRSATVLMLLALLPLLAFCSPFGSQRERESLGVQRQAVTAGDYTENAAFWTKTYLSSSAFLGSYLYTQLSRAHEIYKVKTIYVNAGDLNPDGTLPTISTYYTSNFLRQVAQYEKDRATVDGFKFKVMPIFNAKVEYNCTIPSTGEYGHNFAGTCLAPLTLSSATTRANVAAEALKFTAAPGDAGGTYAFAGDAGQGLSARSWDGINLDVEPSGSSKDGVTPWQSPPGTFNGLKTLAQAIRATSARVAISAPGRLLTSGSNNWEWTPSEYYYMARYADIALMSYGLSPTSEGNYQTKIQDLLKAVLPIVHGHYGTWTSTDHPPPGDPGINNDPRVYVGFPGYWIPGFAPHDPAKETVTAAVNGTFAALDYLAANDSVVLQYFGGAFMYQHRSGCLTTASSGPCADAGGVYLDSWDQATQTNSDAGPPDAGFAYGATWSTDWWRWGRHWLGAW